MHCFQVDHESEGEQVLIHHYHSALEGCSSLTDYNTDISFFKAQPIQTSEGTRAAGVCKTA